MDFKFNPKGKKNTCETWVCINVETDISERESDAYDWKERAQEKFLINTAIKL
jgi:hypothetical protein